MNMEGFPNENRLGPEIEHVALVRFVPSDADAERAAWGANRNPVGLLDPIRDYTVERVEVHSWHTKVWLVDVGGPFNSSHFIRAESAS